MAGIPEPKPAQVIRYSYLWADEQESGRHEALKDRPAAIGVTILYGFLPARFFRTIRDRLTANIKAGKMRQVPRSE